MRLLLLLKSLLIHLKKVIKLIIEPKFGRYDLINFLIFLINYKINLNRQQLDLHGTDNKKENFILAKNQFDCKLDNNFVFLLIFLIKYFLSVAPLKRAKQIPGYSGHISGKNTHYMDDVIETFEPFTVLRTVQPKLTDPN